MSKELYEYLVPNWSLCALINGDVSGLEEKDIEKIEEFTKQVMGNHGNAFFMLGEESENDMGFRHSNAIDNLGANCTRVFIIGE